MVIIGTEKIEEILIVVVLVMADLVIVEMILDVEEEAQEGLMQTVNHSSSGVGMNHTNEGQQVVATDSVTTIVLVLRQSFLGSRLVVLVRKKPTSYLPLTSLL
jgi:hypothetical protein